MLNVWMFEHCEAVLVPLWGIAVALSPSGHAHVMGTCEAKRADPAACFELVTHPSHRKIPFAQTADILLYFTGLVFRSTFELEAHLGRFGSP